MGILKVFARIKLQPVSHKISNPPFSGFYIISLKYLNQWNFYFQQEESGAGESLADIPKDLVDEVQATIEEQKNEIVDSNPAEPASNTEAAPTSEAPAPASEDTSASGGDSAPADGE